MTDSRVIRNFLKMTPGSFGGNAPSATPALSRTIGALRRPPPGTFSGESRAATPTGCLRPSGRVGASATPPVPPVSDERITEAGDTRITEAGDTRITEGNE